MREEKASKVGQEYLLESFLHFRNELYRSAIPKRKYFQSKN